MAKVVEYMQAGDDDPAIRIIVLTGVGRAFSAGADFRGPKDDEPLGDLLPGNRSPREGLDADRQQFFHGFSKLHHEISLIRKPTVAMVNGVAAGSGMDMALHCDIRIGCEYTRFLSYHQVGQIIENGGCYFLPRLAGLGRALEFAYTGQMDAEQAYRWGILNHLVPSLELEQFTHNLCQQMLGVAPISQWVNKRIMRAALDGSLETSVALTSNAAPILANAEDSKEARRAFAEKRPPVFRGR